MSGSGFHFKLAPGESVPIKDTDYVLINKGQFTVDLQLCTKEYAAEQVEAKRQQDLKNELPIAHRGQGRRYWVKVGGKK